MAKKIARKASKKSAKKPAPKKKAAKKAAAPVAPKANQINPYLNFPGNCEVAFNFYRSVFGGKFSFVGRFKDMPPVDGKTMSPEQGEKIMHVSLPISKETTLMGSDSSEEFGQVTNIGNNFSISITAKSANEAERLYNGLASDGTAFMPMSKTFWGSYFGMLTDKFGITWMISFG
ncbi:MAG: VOC family protein [Bacteroidia bacterium]